MLKRLLPSIFCPAICHVRGRRPPFVEGWYYKLVDRTQRHQLAVMPCVCLARDATESHAFVQVYHAASGYTSYSRYPLEEFWSAKDVFDIRIGPNRFTADQISLDVRSQQGSICGSLEMRDSTPWPVTWSSPGIMGWYAWMPFMQCYHGIVSLDHAIHGTIDINGQSICFDKGRGYTEKDWGRSFPEAWIWFQCNHFDEPGTSLTASAAIIPWLRRPFTGFIIGVLQQGKLHRFATYTGAKIAKLEVADEHIYLTVQDKRQCLEMHVIGAEGHSLLAPTPIGMDGRVVETLNGTVQIVLSELKNRAGREVFRGTGRHAGIETAGDLKRLLKLSTIKKHVPSEKDRL